MMMPSPVVKHVFTRKCPHCQYTFTLTVHTVGGRPPQERLRNEGWYAIDACMNPLCRKVIYVQPENMVWGR